MPQPSKPGPAFLALGDEDRAAARLMLTAQSESGKSSGPEALEEIARELLYQEDEDRVADRVAAAILTLDPLAPIGLSRVSAGGRSAESLAHEALDKAIAPFRKTCAELLAMGEVDLAVERCHGILLGLYRTRDREAEGGELCMTSIAPDWSLETACEVLELLPEDLRDFGDELGDRLAGWRHDLLSESSASTRRAAVAAGPKAGKPKAARAKAGKPKAKKAKAGTSTTPKAKARRSPAAKRRTASAVSPPAGASATGEVLRIKVTLDGIRPPIWRRIEISADATFWQLHVAIQDAMGWTDSHLHEFAVGSSYRGTRIGLPGAATDFSETLPGWRVSVRELLRAPGDRVKYWYDFGDDWRHTVRLEKRLPPAPGVSYPRCVSGRRACPPEDCGGVWGYQNLLEILDDPSHPEHADMREWFGGPLDPEAFDPGAVVFGDPEERLQMRAAFGGL